VTHDQGEALAMADHVLLLKDGAIIQEGAPIDIYSRPTNRYSAEFLGANNVIEGRVACSGAGDATISGSDWALDGVVRGADGTQSAGSGVAIVRVEQVRIVDGPGPNRLPLLVDACLYLGDHWEYRLSRGEVKLRAVGATPLAAREVWGECPKEHVWIFPMEDGAAGAA
jgi:iron(III) transport system ATP-binding protein